MGPKAIGEDIQSDLEKWRNLVLTFPCAFVKVESMSDRYWRHLQMREDLFHLGETIKRTSIQRAFDVIEARELMEVKLGLSPGTMSAKQAEKCWTDSVKLAEKSERVTGAFIDSALTVFKRVMCDATMKAMIIDADTRFDGAFTVSRLDRIVGRASSLGLIRWTISLLYNKLERGDLKVCDFADRRAARATNLTQLILSPYGIPESSWDRGE